MKTAEELDALTSCSMYSGETRERVLHCSVSFQVTPWEVMASG